MWPCMHLSTHFVVRSRTCTNTLSGMLQLLLPVDVAGNAGCLYGRHRMQLKGLLPPWVLSRLCAVLADSQDGQFQARS